MRDHSHVWGWSNTRFEAKYWDTCVHISPVCTGVSSWRRYTTVTKSAFAAKHSPLPLPCHCLHWPVP